mmetsp:Transcript_2573/g.8065  ORF Transcript_2573/g.8065 Transcript_2573/m.8065 type:complete len:245 (+) Transcript_2573:462-1196(+)
MRGLGMVGERCAEAPLVASVSLVTTKIDDATSQWGTIHEQLCTAPQRSACHSASMATRRAHICLVMPAAAASSRSVRHWSVCVASSAHGNTQHCTVEKSGRTCGSAKATRRTSMASTDDELYAMAERTMPASESDLARAPCGPSLRCMSCFMLPVDCTDRRRKGSRPPRALQGGLVKVAAATSNAAHSAVNGAKPRASGGRSCVAMHAALEPAHTAERLIDRSNICVMASIQVVAAARRGSGET